MVNAPERGFTLLELAVVMVVISLLLAVSGPSVDKLSETLEYRDAVRQLISAHKKARRAARASGNAVDVVIDANKNRFAVTSDAHRLEEKHYAPLADNLRIEVTFAQEISPGNGLAAIRFYPEGGASGGEVLIQRPSGSGTRLTIDWLIGDVRRESL